jgi:hypothetical protein
VNSRLAHDLLFHSYQNELLKSYDERNPEKILEYPLSKRTDLMEGPFRGGFFVLENVVIKLPEIILYFSILKGESPHP